MIIFGCWSFKRKWSINFRGSCKRNSWMTSPTRSLNFLVLPLLLLPRPISDSFYFPFSFFPFSEEDFFSCWGWATGVGICSCVLEEEDSTMREVFSRTVISLLWTIEKFDIFAKKNDMYIYKQITRSHKLKEERLPIVELSLLFEVE